MTKPERSGIIAKVRAIFDLLRIDLVFGAGIFVVAGELLSLGKFPPLNLTLFGFLTGFLISASANISNDYFDRDVDRINLPERPLPSGRISITQLWTLFLVFTVAGLATALILSPRVFILALIVWGLAFLYNLKLKETGFFGNLIVACCVAMTIIIGAVTAGAVNGVVLTFAALAFLFDLGEEIASDAMDVKGDKIRSQRSIATRKSKTYAVRLSGIIFLVFIALTFLPYLYGWLGFVYLLLIGITDLCLSYFIFRLFSNISTEDGRTRIRQLYLTWGIFVIVFVVLGFFG